jgi:hypothetical protein
VAVELVGTPVRTVGLMISVATVSSADGTSYVKLYPVEVGGAEEAPKVLPVSSMMANPAISAASAKAVSAPMKAGYASRFHQAANAPMDVTMMGMASLITQTRVAPAAPSATRIVPPNIKRLFSPSSQVLQNYLVTR